MSKTRKNAEKRAARLLKERMRDIDTYFNTTDPEKAQKLWDEGDDNLPPFTEYGLSLDWVEPDGKDAGHLRWQLSTGGPGDEINFYPRQYGPAHVEYVYLDWFARIEVDITSTDTAHALWDWFEELLPSYREAAQ